MATFIETLNINGLFEEIRIEKFSNGEIEVFCGVKPPEEKF